MNKKWHSGASPRAFDSLDQQYILVTALVTQYNLKVCTKKPWGKYTGIMYTELGFLVITNSFDR